MQYNFFFFQKYLIFLDLILGVGDGKSNSFRGFEYSYSVLNVFNDVNMQPYNQTWHPRIPGLVYWFIKYLKKNNKFF